MVISRLSRAASLLLCSLIIFRALCFNVLALDFAFDATFGEGPFWSSAGLLHSYEFECFCSALSLMGSTLLYIAVFVLRSACILLIIAIRHSRLTLFILTGIIVLLRLALNYNRRKLSMIMLRRGVSRRKRWHMYGRAGFADDFDDDVPSISTPRSWFSFASWIQSSVSRSGTGSWTERVSIRFDGTALCDFGFDSCANVHYVGNKKLLRNYRSHSGATWSTRVATIALR